MTTLGVSNETLSVTMESARPSVSFRPETDADGALVRALLLPVRRAELAEGGLPPEVLDPIARSQVEIELASRGSGFSALERRLVLADGEPVGVLLVDSTSERLFGVDIAIVPPEQRRGIGTAAIARLVVEAGSRPFVIRARRGGRALQLYLRLGFCPTSQDETHVRLEWRHHDFQAHPSRTEASRV